jgi:hypothetical protein
MHDATSRAERVWRRRARLLSWSQTEAMTSQAKKKLAKPPAAPPPATRADGSARQVTTAIDRAIITLNGAIKIAAASLGRRMDSHFKNLERVLAVNRGKP